MSNSLALQIKGAVRSVMAHAEVYAKDAVTYLVGCGF
jgi:hypothetical protein